jgi:hypothetical protein
MTIMLIWFIGYGFLYLLLKLSAFKVPFNRTQNPAGLAPRGFDSRPRHQ